MDNLTDEEREILKSEYYTNKQRQAIVKLLSTISALRAQLELTKETLGQTAEDWAKSFEDGELMLKEIEALRAEIQSLNLMFSLKLKGLRFLKMYICLITKNATCF